jgi:hypothetical protein
MPLLTISNHRPISFVPNLERSLLGHGAGCEADAPETVANAQWTCSNEHTHYHRISFIVPSMSVDVKICSTIIPTLCHPGTLTRDADQHVTSERQEDAYTTSPEVLA